MNVLIAYGSHLGSTATIAEEIGETIRRATDASVTVRPASSGGPIEPYDAVIVGGGIYAGRWHPDSVSFVRLHANALASRPVWFFSSGPLGAAAATPTPLAPFGITDLIELVGARGHVTFGGSHDRSEVDESEFGRLEKFIAKRFVPEGDWRDWDAIEAWARSVASELQPSPIAAS